MNEKGARGDKIGLKTNVKRVITVAISPSLPFGPPRSLSNIVQTKSETSKYDKGKANNIKTR